MILKKLAGSILYRAAETALGMSIILWSFRHMGSVLPIHRVRDSSNIIAFYNPEPLYPVHILIMPKRRIHGFMDLTPADSALMMEIVQTAQSLVEELKLDEAGFRLIVNGGKYQTAPQLHFHLVSGEANQ